MQKLLTSLLAGAVLLAGNAAAAQFNFDTPANVPAGTQPGATALGDFDGDLDLDMAVTSDAPDRVLIFMNNGDGTFAAPTPVFLGGGSGPDAIVSGNWDGDADTDLAVVLKGIDSVQVLTNNGAGVFALGAISAVGAEPVDIQTGDLDGDTDLDLVTSNRSANSISVLLNAGGAFGAATSYPGGMDLRALTLGDFSGDMRPEVAVASHDDRTVIVFTNNGSGGFGAPSTLSVGPNWRPEGVVAADLDGDNDMDLVAAISGNAMNLVAVFINAGGVLSGPFTYPVGGIDPGYIVASDFDLDGDNDVATANNTSGDVSVLPNNGAGVFGAATVIAAGTTTERVVAGDLNGSGAEGIVATNRDSNDVTVIRNLAGAGFEMEPVVPGMAGVVNTLTATGGSPMGRVVFAAGGSINGQTPIGPCAGLFFSIRNAKQLAVVTANAGGVATFMRSAPARFAGRTLHFQALDRATCTVSNRVSQIF